MRRGTKIPILFDENVHNIHTAHSTQTECVCEWYGSGVQMLAHLPAVSQARYRIENIFTPSSDHFHCSCLVVGTGDWEYCRLAIVCQQFAYAEIVGCHIRMPHHYPIHILLITTFTLCVYTPKPMLANSQPIHKPKMKQITVVSRKKNVDIYVFSCIHSDQQNGVQHSIGVNIVLTVFWLNDITHQPSYKRMREHAQENSSSLSPTAIWLSTSNGAFISRTAAQNAIAFIGPIGPWIVRAQS